MKSKLRHPIRAIEEPFGKAGLVVAVIALVIATTGAAFAAVGLNSKQKKEVTKIAKKFAGKPGANGATGPAGAAGAKGEAGAAGKDGTNGQSVTGEPIAAGGACGAGVTGVKYTLSATSTNVCNGKNGTTGFTESLPSKKTEMGTWVAQYNATDSEGEPEFVRTSISFPIPLATPATPGKAANAEFLTSGNSTSHCPGDSAQPSAEPGYLCVYENVSVNISGFKGFGNLESPTFPTFASRYGVLVNFENEAIGPVLALGSWAVTAE